MIDVETAIRLALERQVARYENASELLRRCMPQFAIDRAAIRETPFAWILPWQDRRYLETGDIRHAVDGASPFVVMKESGEVSSLPSHKIQLLGRLCDAGGEDFIEERIAALTQRHLG